MRKILEDEREIKRITMPDTTVYEVGKFQCTKIQPYEENGEMAYVVWFAVYIGDLITARVNSKYIDTVQY